MPYKANEPRRHKIPRARYKIENWAEYDAALRRRGSLTVWVTPEAIAAWAPAATGRRGRPRDYSDVAIETGLMLRLAFGRPWRQTEGLLGSITEPARPGVVGSGPHHVLSSQR
jgi:Transposase DDE domain